MRFPRFSVLFVVSAALSRVVGGPATPPWGEMLVKHEWTHIPVNWVTQGHPPDDASIELHIALKPDREKALTDALLEVSQPGSPKYGAHLTMQQVAQLVAPHPDTFELVTSWLKYNGVPPSSISTTHGGCWLTVVGVPVSRANRLLGASYQLYHHPGTNETILRTVRYAIPAALHIHVKTIAPTTAFTSMRLLQPKETPRSYSGGAENGTSGEPVNMLSRKEPEERIIDPTSLRWLYKTDTYYPGAIDRNSLGIMGYRNQVPTLVDVARFMNDFRTDEVEYEMPIVREYDVLVESEDGVQATFDAEYAVALVTPTLVFYYRSTGNGMQTLAGGKPSFHDEYSRFLNDLIYEPIISQTISLGYGTPELSISWEYADAQCELFAQLGSRGISILVASGDAGVGQGDCINNYGGIQFCVSFPASCPWVTSVGGATLTSDPSHPNSLVKVGDTLSGGGFSAYFPRHGYQNAAVMAYFDKIGSQYYGYFDFNGRGVPDIALQSSRYIMVSLPPDLDEDNTYHQVNGTSCATITAAATISWLNDYLISSGKSPLGFLNPWLYGIGWFGFNDITTGHNPGCGTPGFYAKEGWDPVTGYGSPDFPLLQSLVSLHPPASNQPRNGTFP